MSDPANAERRKRGIDALQRGDYDAAIAALRAYLEVSPDDVEVLVFLGVACSQRGAHEAALAALERAAKLAPTSANVQYNRALTQERAGAVSAAQWGYTEALRLDPQHSQARQRLTALAGLTAAPPVEAPRVATPASASVDPNLASAPIAEEAGTARPNLIRCPFCRAHTRRSLHCERCSKELPPHLRPVPLDPERVNVPAPEVGERFGGLAVTAVKPHSLELKTVGPLGSAALGLGGLCLLAGLALGAFAIQPFRIDRLMGGVFLIVLGVLGLQLFAQLVRSFSLDGVKRRVELSRVFGMKKSVWRAEQFDSVHLSVDLPDRDGQERCWVRFQDRSGKVHLQIGPAHASDAHAAHMVTLGVHLARIFRLPLQVDGFPRHAANELREALALLG